MRHWPRLARRRLLRSLTTACLAICFSACGSSTSSDTAADTAVGKLLAELHELEVRFNADHERAAAFRALEFFGDAAPRGGLMAEVVVVACPPIPEPESSEYPDCVGFFEVRTGDGPRQVSSILAAPVFHDRRPMPMARAEQGDKLLVHVVPWQWMPESTRSVQRVTATDDVTLDIFAAIDVRFDSSMRRVEITPPERASGRTSRATRIERSIAEIERRLARHDNDPAAWRESLQPYFDELRAKARAAKGPIFEGRFCFRNFSYIDHRRDDSWPEPQIACLTSLHQQLARRGIDLIVVPFPEQEQVSACQILDNPPADGLLDVEREMFHLQLLRAGVEVIDARPALQAATTEHPHVYYDAIDGHPADGAIRVVARLIADRLDRYGFEPQYRYVHQTVRLYRIPDRQRFPKFRNHSYESDMYSATMVLDEGVAPLKPMSNDGPFLLLGDSFADVPRFYSVAAANLLPQIASFTGVLGRAVLAGGSGPSLAHQMHDRGPDTLRGVRAVVYVFRENMLFQNDEKSPNRCKVWSCPELGT